MARGQTIKFLQAPRLARFPWLVHGFTTRQPGQFNLNYSVAKDPAVVEKNRRALLRALTSRKNADGWQLATLRQRHTDIIQVIPEASGSHRRRGAGLGRTWRERDGALKLVGDALITNQPGWLLAVQVADCLPVLLVAPERRAVAAVHAGWRGTAKRIAEKAVGRMRQAFGSDPKRMLAVIGPGIHRCCYEVGREVVEAYEARFPYWEKLVRRTEPSPSQVHWQQPLLSPAGEEPRPRPAVTAPPGEKFHLDLVEATRRQLLAAGLKARNIWASPHCTACRTDLFFSHRAERGRTGRMMGVVGIVQG